MFPDSEEMLTLVNTMFNALFGRRYDCVLVLDNILIALSLQLTQLENNCELRAVRCSSRLLLKFYGLKNLVYYFAPVRWNYIDLSPFTLIHCNKGAILFVQIK